ncbi:MAG: L-threonylcarbamoyladenylate synthase [Phormidesmis sp. CAN_BIN36]|nr:L-threonylcarbamoyladenylate synthase [Phormidesmis sp. CAN_BIN36]
MAQVSFSTLVSSVRSGDHLISFPTDTIPALAARPDRANLIFTTKQRSLDKPLILMAEKISDLWQYVAGTEAERQAWQQVAERYLPGALTLVLPASDRVPVALNPTNPTTIGVRVPNHAIARSILAETGALATTSANQSGQPALQNMSEIEIAFSEVMTLLPSELDRLGLDPQVGSGMPSTVVKWTGHEWEILRQGAIALSLLNLREF